MGIPSERQRSRAARTPIRDQGTKLQGTQRQEKSLGKMKIGSNGLRNTTYIYSFGTKSRGTGKPE